MTTTRAGGSGGTSTARDRSGAFSKRKSSLLDLAFSSFALVIYGGAVISPLRTLRGLEPQQVGESEPVMAACQTVILLALIFVMILRRDRILPLVRPMLPYMLIVGVCIASTIWSDHPMSTLRRSTTLGICVVFGVYMYDAFGMRRLIDVISGVALSLALVSLIARFGMPQIGQEQAAEYNGAMRGIFAQKNGMAEYMLLGIVCRCYLVIETRRLFRFFCTAGLLYSCIILAQSVTSLLIATIVLVVTGWMLVRDAPRARLAFAFAVSSGVIVLIAGLLLVPDQVFAIVGRDETLTGRLPLWRLVISTIADRPLLGHGYSGFWAADSIDAQYLWERAGWVAPDSHNGYLDIVLQIGVLGIALYGWLWARILRLAWKAWSAGTLPVAAWILLFMMINLLVNLDEGPLPWADEFTAAGPAALITMEVWNNERRRAGVSAGRQSGVLVPQFPRPVVARRSRASVVPNTGSEEYGHGL